MGSVERNRLEHIDALRGLAALCVLFQHGAVPIALQYAAGSPAREFLSGQWFDLGRFGVLLFFFVSGFVIPFSLKGRNPLPRFVIRRIFRLYPPFWLSVVVVAFSTAILGETRYPPVQIAANLTMAPVLFHQTYLSGVYWTLFIELLFYVACAMLFAAGLLRSAPAILLIGLGCVAVPVGGVLLRHAGYPVPILYLTEHLSFLFAGSLIRMATFNEHRGAKVCAAILVSAALAAMPLLAMQPDHVFTISTPLGVLLGASAAVAVFILSNVRPFRPTGFLLWLGTISYSVYLFHAPIGHLVELIVPLDGVTGKIVQFVLMLISTVTFAALVYRFLEHPSIALGRRLTGARRETLAMDVAP